MAEEGKLKSHVPKRLINENQPSSWGKKKTKSSKNNIFYEVEFIEVDKEKKKERTVTHRPTYSGIISFMIFPLEYSMRS